MDSRCGVAQGSVLSPTLFNLVLHDALRSSSVLSQIIARGDISAYADDMRIHSSSLEELR